LRIGKVKNAAINGIKLNDRLHRLASPFLRVLMEYLQVMIALEDWHGVADLAMDMRELKERQDSMELQKLFFGKPISKHHTEHSTASKQS